MAKKKTKKKVVKKKNKLPKITKKQKDLARKKGGISLKTKTETRQVGTSKKKRDKRLNALPPGKRLSRNGNVYYEYRKNRSDKKNRI